MSYCDRSGTLSHRRAWNNAPSGALIANNLPTDMTMDPSVPPANTDRPFTLQENVVPWPEACSGYVPRVSQDCSLPPQFTPLTPQQSFGMQSNEVHLFREPSQNVTYPHNSNHTQLQHNPINRMSSNGTSPYFRQTVALPNVVNSSNRRRQLKEKSKLFFCEMCSASLTTKHNLEFRRRAHLGIKEFSCDQCDKLFTTPWDSKRHAKKCSIRRSRARS
ncbi:hypothetical protein PM082_022562 [Marasmius tenuissimus]|nr:hypothetical protein PM082_022562 [Marasmius tenuissimus]